MYRIVARAANRKHVDAATSFRAFHSLRLRIRKLAPLCRGVKNPSQVNGVDGYGRPTAEP